ncbi:MAG: protoporphyrinogen oxidase [Myxococcales bacterium]|nr:protoporphyrinogen oxidase [Myxococcales bacterium]
MTIAIVGAGISGLVLGYRLREAGCAVRLFDGAERAGGVVQSVNEGGYLCELGPNTVAGTAEYLLDLTDDLGLENELVTANPAANKRYILLDGELHPVPTNPIAFIQTPLLSGRAKLRMFAEPFIPKRRRGEEESLSDFVSRRLGPEVASHLLDPFISGVYAGDPTTLSAAASFPKLAELERVGGSLFLGAIKSAFGKRKNVQPHKKRRRSMYSFIDGLGTITGALARSLAGETELGTAISAIRREPDGYYLSIDALERRGPFQRIVITTSAPAAASLVESLSSEAADELRAIDLPPVSVCHLGYSRQAVGHPLDGFGFLIPSSERRSILGVLFSSSLFPNRAPGGQILLTVFLGGAHHRDIAGLGADPIVQRAEAEVRELLEISEAARFSRVQRWARAIPQYTLGHDDRIARARNALTAAPGVTLAGSFVGGISVEQRVEAANKLAIQMIQEWRPGRGADETTSVSAR